VQKKASPEITGFLPGGESMSPNLLNWCFKKSIWVYHANAGSCNGCDIEVLNVLTPYYDVERFGIKLVGSPRHADVMLCQGPAMRSTAKALRRAYDAMAAPKLVFAIGSCACRRRPVVRHLQRPRPRREGGPGRHEGDASRRWSRSARR
jgi:hypothetical protein